MTNKKSKITNLRNVYLSCGLAVLSVAGLLHTWFGGGWSKKTGEAAKMYPRLVYTVLLVVALYLLLKELLGKVPFEPPAITVVKWWQVPVVLGVASAFFLFSIHVGTAVGIFMFPSTIVEPDTRRFVRRTVNLDQSQVALIGLPLPSFS